jgi:hypothetical protein
VEHEQGRNSLIFYWLHWTAWEAASRSPGQGIPHVDVTWVYLTSNCAIFRALNHFPFNNQFRSVRVILTKKKATISFDHISLSVCLSTRNNLAPTGRIFIKFRRYNDSLRAGRSGDRIPVWSKFSASVQTRPGAHPSSYTMGTGSFPGVKRPGCTVYHPPPSSAEVKEGVELYIYFPSGP